MREEVGGRVEGWMEGGWSEGDGGGGNRGRVEVKGGGGRGSYCCPA